MEIGGGGGGWGGFGGDGVGRSTVSSDQRKKEARSRERIEEGRTELLLIATGCCLATTLITKGKSRKENDQRIPGKKKSSWRKRIVAGENHAVLPARFPMSPMLLKGS